MKERKPWPTALVTFGASWPEMIDRTVQSRAGKIVERDKAFGRYIACHNSLIDGAENTILIAGRVGGQRRQRVRG